MPTVGETEGVETGQSDQCDQYEGHLWMVDAQTLDFMQWQQNSDQKHLVFFFQRESETVDDAARRTGVVRQTRKRDIQGHVRADITGERLTCPVSLAAQRCRCDALSHI